MLITRKFRPLVFLMALMISFSAGVATAAAAPAISEAAWTNPIGYELKSLQWTHFYATFDRPVWAVLTVHDGAGHEVARVYDGAVPEAGKRFWFPSWNGKAAGGRRLPSSAGYTWRLRAYRNGEVTEKAGRIAISRIIFTIKSTLVNDEWPENQLSREVRWDRYMVDGKTANMYIQASAPSTETDYPGFFVTMGGRTYNTHDPRGNAYTASIKAGSSVNAAVYLRNGWDFDTGMNWITVNTWDMPAVTYAITVLQ